MKTYVVGGAVRDRLLGLPVSDRDHVVVGATVDEMLAAGFKPVGRDFPVFLHPRTHEEYALARTERKVAPGYAGFVFHADPSVTLEADLARRDLTINAMAEDEASGQVVDPYGGRDDLERRVFRHVGPAFAEDPVRVLRLARFAARFASFDVAPETLGLMRSMTAAGEIDALVPERVWQELSRGLMAAQPSRMLDVLRDAGALARLLPEVAPLLPPDGAVPIALDRAAAAGHPLEVRFAVLMHAVDVPRDAQGNPVATLSARLAVPTACRDLAVLVARERTELVAADDAARLVTVMADCDAFRRPDRYRQVIAAVGSTIGNDAERATFAARRLDASTAAEAIDAGSIAREAHFEPQAIAAGLRAARITAIRAALSNAD